MTRITVEEFRNFFKYYKDEAHQRNAIETFYNDAPDHLVSNNAEWIVEYRTRQSTPEPTKEDGICTPELMQKLTGYAAAEFDSVFCNDCNRLFADTGFDKHLDAMQMLMANCLHETASFLYMKEIADGWAYEGRSDLGNTSPGDGPRYKGAGVLQLTGKYNYSRLAKGIDDPRVMEGVDYVSNTYPFTSARIWIEENDLLNVCLTQGFEACCIRINGGRNGLDDRYNRYEKCKRFMV